MLADIGSPDLYVQTNELAEVTSGTMFGSQSTAPDENGLVSYEIFGNPGSKQRAKNFAYIDLGDIFIHPMAYDAIIMLSKPIKGVINGEGYYYLDREGKIVKVNSPSEAPSGVDCGQGCHWLKRNIRKIDFTKDKMSNVRKDRISFLNSLKDDEMFITKWLVIPAYYRDVDINTNKKNDINMMYQNILSQAKTVKSMKTMFDSEEVTDSHRKIQEKINEMYRYFLTFMAGTKAFIQKHVLGKAPDYSSRMVITTARINCNRPDDMITDYAHSGVPLSMVLEDFAPFIEYGFKQFIRNQINGSDYVYTKDKDGNIRRIALAPHWEQCMLHDNIHSLIKIYSDSKERRLDYFTIEAENGEQVPIGYVTSKGSLVSSSDSEEVAQRDNIIRPITMCEMFYMIAMDTVKDKQIMITRFPIEDYQNVYPSMMTIIPYENTKKVTLFGKEYPRFPDITLEDIKNRREQFICEKFNDALQLFPTYLAALGADFDGDTVTVQGVFSKNDPMEYINSPMNIVNIGGSTMRSISDINSQMLFALTKTLEDK